MGKGGGGNSSTRDSFCRLGFASLVTVKKREGGWVKVTVKQREGGWVGTGHGGRAVQGSTGQGATDYLCHHTQHLHTFLRLHPLVLGSHRRRDSVCVCRGKGDQCIECLDIDGINLH